MSQGSSLFREQAIAATNNKLYGSVIATPKISYFSFFMLSITWLAFLSYAAFSVEWRSYQYYQANVLAQSGLRARIQLSTAPNHKVSTGETINLYPSSASTENSLKGRLINQDINDKKWILEIQLEKPETLLKTVGLKLVQEKRTFYELLTRENSTKQEFRQ